MPTETDDALDRAIQRNQITGLLPPPVLLRGGAPHPADAEVQAMQVLTVALEPLDIPARNRVLTWAMARHVNAPERARMEERGKS